MRGSNGKGVGTRFSPKLGLRFSFPLAEEICIIDGELFFSSCLVAEILLEVSRIGGLKLKYEAVRATAAAEGRILGGGPILFILGR